jgi:exonuclease VII small subunit
VENYTEALARIKLAKKILEDAQNKVEIIERRDLDRVSTKKSKTKL